MGTQIGYCECSHWVLKVPTSVLLCSHGVRCVLAWSLQEGATWSNRPKWVAVRRKVWHIGSLLRCACASGMPLGTGMGSHPSVGSTTCFPAWTTRNAQMGLTLAHPAHSSARVSNASCYLLGGMHPTSWSRSRLRRTERRASNWPSQGLNTPQSARGARPCQRAP